MISQTIARRYAQALLALGQEDGQLTRYGEELAEFVKAAGQADLVVALTNPLYPREARRKLLDAILAKMKLSKIMENFLDLLQEKGRIGQVKAINDYYQRLVDEARNVKRAMIVTARPLSASAQARVKAAMEKMTGRTIILETKVDPDIIGGLVAQVGDLKMDGSVKTQLKNIRESLSKG
ncbi:MAG: ATP synthase F1 subunit delta [Thermodesulfobacteriota bacterium]